MRVFINAASAHMGGAVTYLQNILEWLPEVAPHDEFIVCVPDATRDQLPVREGVTVRAYPYPSTKGLQRLCFDQVVVPHVVRQEKIDALFSSTGFGSFWSSCPQVLLIRNMAYFDPQFQAKYQQLGRSLAKNTLRRWHSLLSIRRADAILFPTEAMQEMVGNFLRLDSHTSYVIHYGFDEEHFCRDTGAAASEAVSRLQRFCREGCEILLNVSTYAVHKNFETLIEALPLVLQNNSTLKIVTTTSRERTSDKIEYDALKKRANELGVTDSWIELGYVPYRELHALYRSADAYVFPSFTESFGHSMVEAMASGLPVVAAGTLVNREVCGEAGSYFDTFDPVDCAESISSVLRDPEKQIEMAEISRERSHTFSWRKYTEELVRVFREVCIS